MCNFYGTFELLNTMQWSGQQAFVGAQNTTWNYNGQAVGNSRTANGLTYVVAYNSGHMVPHDQVSGMSCTRGSTNNVITKIVLITTLISACRCA
jgi:carboxypeptidase C (cathepsin A)